MSESSDHKKIGKIFNPQALTPRRPSSELLDRVDPVDRLVVLDYQDDWDDYFMSFARLAAANTKCGSRAIGAAIVKDRRVVATGYNGPAAGMDTCANRWREDNPKGNPVRDVAAIYTLGTQVVSEQEYTPWPEGNFCPRRVLGYPSGQGLDICVAAHAERNALLQAARLGISTKDASLYAYCGVPCKDCSIEIVNSGIREVVCLKKDYEYDKLGRLILTTGGVQIREIEDHTDSVFKRMP